MTRDEAIKIQKKHISTNIVDILAELGVLKLDEPKSARDKFELEVFKLGYDPGLATYRDMMTAFDASQK